MIAQETATTSTKVVVSSRMFRKALSFVGGVIKESPILPVLADVHCAIKDGLMTLTGSDLVTTLIDTVPVEANQNFEVCIPYTTVNALLGNLPEQPLTILVDQHYDVTINTVMGGQYQLTGENPVDYPKPHKVAGEMTPIQLDAIQRETLMQAIARCVFAVAVPGNNLERMEGVCWWNDELVATDGHRIIRTKGVASIGKRQCLIPPKNALLMTKLSTSVDSGKSLEVFIGKSSIEFSIDGKTIISPLIDEKFPDFHDAIPLDNPVSWKLDRLALIAALNRLLILANPITKQIVLSGDTAGEVSIQAEELDLRHQGSETLRAEANQDIKITLNGKFLLEGLKSVEGDEVTLSLSTPNRAVLLLGENEAVTSLLAPIAPKLG